MKKKAAKSLYDFKEELHRCSKCGICQDSCPLFQTMGNECTVSRGQFIMLNGVIKGDLNLNKNINKYLDMCLKCNKCTEFCPSEINALDIILAAKYEYNKKSLKGKVYRFFESKYVYNTVLKLFETVLNLFVKKYKSKHFQTKAVYFGGCINKISPKMSNYAKYLLNEMGIEVVETDFQCCGMPFLTTGNIDRFIESAEDNIKNLPENIEYIITDCASCNWAWGEYSKYIDEELRLKLDKVKIKSIYELIEENNIKFELKKEFTVTYHKPCHEKETSSNSIENLLKRTDKIRYEKMAGFDECCGFAAFEHPEVLKDVNPVHIKKRENIVKLKVDYVLTSCAGCLISLNLISKLKYKTKSVLSFLKDYCEIKR